MESESMAVGRVNASRCLEVAIAASGTFAIMGLPEEWDVISGAAETVERVDSLDGWGEFNALYRVELVAGRGRHYMVVEG